MPETTKQPGEPLLISEAAAAKLLGVSPKALWQLRQENKIPHVRIGHRVLYDPNDLPKWIEAQKQGGTGRRQASSDQPPPNGRSSMLPRGPLNSRGQV